MEGKKIFSAHKQNHETNKQACMSTVDHLMSDCFDLESEDEDMEDNLIQWANWRKEQGNDFFRNGKFHNAISIYKEVLDFVIKDIPTDEIDYMSAHNLIVRCYLNMAACYLKLSDFGETLALCNQVISLDDKNVKGLFRRAQAYLNLGRFDCAKDDLERALVIDPNNKEVKNALFDVCNEISRSIIDKKAKMKGKLFVEDIVPMELGLEQGSTSSCSPVSTLECASMDFGVPRTIDGNTDLGYVKEDVSTFSDRSNLESVVSDCESQFGGKRGEKIVSMPLLRFGNKKKRPSRCLNLEQRAYNKLVDGDKLTFFNNQSLSFMTVRVVNEVSCSSGENLMMDTTSSHIPVVVEDNSSLVSNSIEIEPKLDHLQLDVSGANIVSVQGEFEESIGPSPHFKKSRSHPNEATKLNPDEGYFAFSTPGKKRHRCKGSSPTQCSQLEHAYGMKVHNKVKAFKCSLKFSCREARRMFVERRASFIKRKYTPSIGCKRKQPSNSVKDEQAPPSKRATLIGLHLQGVASEQVFRYFGNPKLMGGEEFGGQDRWCANGSEAVDSSMSHTQSVQESSSGCSQAYSDNMKSTAFCF